jgi:hypothetical protein
MDLGAVKEQIATHEGLGQIRSMEYAKTWLPTTI